jgi:hypothetical protein
VLARWQLVRDRRLAGSAPMTRPTTIRQADWHTDPQTDIEAAIRDFKAALPGWWYSVCECQVSCDASCAPTTESPHVDLIDLEAAFDSGFHADLRQPSTLAEALRDVMEQAQAAIKRVSP